MSGSSSSRSGGMRIRNVLADGFAASVPEDSLGALVPARDEAIEVFGDDGVVGIFNDGGQKSQAFGGGFAFEIVGGLAGEQVEQTRFAVGNNVWRGEMR